MLESEKTSLVGRVQDLERRVMEQQDEIVYLKSTLSDVLRRLNLLDGGGGFERAGSVSGLSSGQRSAPTTPARNGSISKSKFFLRISLPKEWNIYLIFFICSIPTSNNTLK
jgi:hypothetical protein